jgi:hypothetical protein
MGVEAEGSKKSFSVRNGREIFDNGGVRLWRCPVCAWWRQWCEDRCCGCGLSRDNPAAARVDHAGNGGS